MPSKRGSLTKRSEIYESRVASDRRGPIEATYWGWGGGIDGPGLDPTYYSTSLPEHMEAWNTATTHADH